jgi:hypothetical protein
MNERQIIAKTAEQGLVIYVKRPRVHRASYAGERSYGNVAVMVPGRLDKVRCVIVDRPVVQSTLGTLQQFGARKLEGLVLWLGEIKPGRAHVMRAFTPHQHSVSGEDGVGYFVGGETLFELNRALAESGLRLIAQVHSHPNRAYHSDTDDRYAIITVDGGLSLVVPNFGQAPADPTSWAVYRLVQSRWCELSTDEARALLSVREEQ